MADHVSPEPDRRRKAERPTTQREVVQRVQLLIESKLKKSEGKRRLSESLFPLLSKLDFSNVDSRQAVEMIRQVCSEIEIIDTTDQIVDHAPSISSNLLRTMPTPHMLINLGNNQRVLIVPKDIDLLLIYHPVNQEERITKGAWVCGNVITL